MWLHHLSLTTFSYSGDIRVWRCSEDQSRSRSPEPAAAPQRGK